MNIANLKIRTRLGLAFAVLLALMLAMAGIGISNMGRIQDNLDRIVQVNVYKMKLLQDMNSSVHIVSRVVRTLVILEDQAAMAGEHKKIEAARAKYDMAQAALEKMAASQQAQSLRAKLRELEHVARPLNNKVIELGLANNNQAATTILMQQAGPATQNWLDTLEQDIALQVENGERDVQAAQDTYAAARTLMFTLAAAGLVLSALMAWLVTQSITQPINAAVKVAQTVASGDLNSTIDASTKDETGQLLQALQGMNSSLRRIVGQVRSGTDMIATASTEIAKGNLDLSARTEQQAGSLEETASSLEELTGTVQQNAANARQANVLAVSASSVALRGGQIVTQVVDTMGAISASSSKIVDIIAVIDGIAFQTNILALNAAVEAARAGEQGRGFAVVASEVRNLAQRSASAAKEIKALIGDSVAKVDTGSKLVEQAGTTMGEIVDSIQRVTDIMGQISQASQEQSAGIEQINQAISEMDNVTQQNAALVEQSAAAAQSLQEQSGALAQAVSVFKLEAADLPVPAKNNVVALAHRPAGQRARSAGAAAAQWDQF